MVSRDRRLICLRRGIPRACILLAALTTRACWGFVVTSQNESLTFTVQGASSGFEITRYSGSASEIIMYAADYHNGRESMIAASITPTPLINDPVAGPCAPRQTVLTVGMPSFDADEYTAVTATNWNDNDEWPVAPGLFAVERNDYLFKKTSTNAAYIRFFGQWLNSPTNSFRTGPSKEIIVYVVSYDDLYGYEDILDAPWLKGLLRWTLSFPRRPQGCGGCSAMGLPVYQINTATLNPVISDIDYAYDGLGPPVSLGRVYSGDPTARGLFGNGWQFTFECFLGRYEYGIVVEPGGGRHILFGSPTYTNGIYTYRAQRGSRDMVTVTNILHVMSYYEYKERETEFIYRCEIPYCVDGPCLGRYPIHSITDRNGNSIHLEWTNNRLLAVVDAAGRVTTLQYNTNGLCTNMIVPNGLSASFTYSAGGNLLSSRDVYGNLTTYTYNGSNLLETMTTDGRTWTFRYNGYKVSEVVDPLGATNRFSIGDAFLSNRTVVVADAKGNETTYYSRNGETWRTRMPDSNAVARGFNADGFPTAVTNARGAVTRMTYDSERNLRSVTLPNGAATTYGYDSENRLVAETNALGGVRRLTYDSRGNLVRYETPAGRTVSFGYDNLGRLTAVTGGLGQVTRLGYDAFGNVAWVQDALGHTTKYAYDAYGIELVAVTNARGFVTRFEHDSLRRLTRTLFPDGQERRRVFDCCAQSQLIDEHGHTTMVVRAADLLPVRWMDPLGHAYSNAYDRNRNLQSATDAMGHTDRYGYDSRNRLTSHTNASGAATYIGYFENSLVQKVERTRGASDYYSFIYNMDDTLWIRRDAFWRAQVFSYDALQRMTNRWNARNQSISFTYDADGLLVRKTTSDSTWEYAYDAHGWLVAFSNAASGATLYTRDAMGHVTAITYPDGLQARFSYNAMGSVTSIVYPGGVTVLYERDSRERVTNMTWGASWIRFSYDAAGLLTRELRSNGGESLYSYDRADRLTNLLHRIGTSNLLQLALQRDALGQTTNLIKQGGWVPWMPVMTAGAITAAVDSVDRLTNYAGQAVGHDADGNVTNCPALGWSATYDAENRMTSISRSGTNAVFVYDGLGRRTRSTMAGGTRNAHCDAFGRLLFETDAGGSVTARYFYRDGALVAMQAEGGVHFYFFNHIGSTIAMADEDGRISALYRYLPYGEVAGGYSRIRNPFTFVGRHGVVDDGNGLFLMTTRHYDARLGRFLSTDPIWFTGGMNLYEYAGGNPMEKTDPDGLNPDSDDSDGTQSLEPILVDEEGRVYTVQEALDEYVKIDLERYNNPDYHYESEEAAAKDKQKMCNLATFLEFAAPLPKHLDLSEKSLEQVTAVDPSRLYPDIKVLLREKQRLLEKEREKSRPWCLFPWLW